MTPYEYVSVLTSIIVGLAVTHILMAWGRFFSGLRGYRTSVIHIMWTVNLLFYLVFFWWFSFKWEAKGDLSFGTFLFILSYAILLFLLAVVLVPVDAPEGFHYGDHFLERGRIFFGGWLLVYVIDIGDTILKGPENLAKLGPLYPWVMAVMMATAAMAMLSKRRSYHWFYSFFWPVFMIVWILHAMGATSVLRGTR